MAHYDASNAECLVFSFKEGLLSKMAHDLKIRVTRFEIEGGAESVEATFDAHSLRVECARRDGRDDPGTLGDRDRRQIEANIVNDVLHAKRYREVRFVSTTVEERDGGYDVRGELTLHGRTRPLTAHARREGDRLVAEVDLHQPDYGITPYKAALGALRVQPRVRVRVSVPAP